MAKPDKLALFSFVNGEILGWLCGVGYVGTDMHDAKYNTGDPNDG